MGLGTAGGAAGATTGGAGATAGGAGATAAETITHKLPDLITALLSSSWNMLAYMLYDYEITGRTGKAVAANHPVT